MKQKLQKYFNFEKTKKTGGEENSKVQIFIKKNYDLI